MHVRSPFANGSSLFIERSVTRFNHAAQTLDAIGERMSTEIRTFCSVVPASCADVTRFRIRWLL